ncbi:hypothetical protein [Bdellovibrio sp. NC01]|uniref:hypothetical protein n=1 Tax=Bdellovibrio sp. NC01 TaxID=2220073 RepID=UPI00115B5F06|nr:hypothetical protein [Bdellovibrio sp. NC01]QDK36937.1 hypothetical protein DOE51_04690 [Bdellovibrio sp. NC01]
MKRFILAVVMLGLGACAYDKDKSGSTSQARQVEEDNKQVEGNFQPIVGYYLGSLKRASGVDTIAINLFTLAYKDGTNPDGTDRIRYKLSASYSKKNPAGKPLVDFSISYIPETGDLKLVNTKASDNIDEVNTIKARVMNGRIIGQVFSSTRKIGTIDLALSADESANPDNGAQEEYNDLLRKQYADLAGNYVGCVTPAADGSATEAYTVTMTISMYEDAGSDPTTTLPRLAGMFHRNYDKLGGLDTSLSATYRPDLTPATLNIVGKPKITNNGYVSTFNGYYSNGDFAGTFTSTNKGLEGNIFFKKGKVLPAQCAGVTK